MCRFHRFFSLLEKRPLLYYFIQGFQIFYVLPKRLSGICWKTFAFSRLLCSVNSVAINIEGHAYTCLSICLQLIWVCVHSGMAGSHDDSMFRFLRVSQHVSHSREPSSVTASSRQAFQFLHIMANVYLFIFNYSHPSGWRVVPYCGFYVHFPNG